MKIYVDSNFHCHTTNPDGTFQEIEEKFFNGKCTAFVDGYCYNDSKGYVQIYPWKPYAELDSAQREYERQLLAELQKNSILVSALESAYQEGVNSID